MTQRNEEKSWAQEVSATLGSELQKARKAAGISAEKLAELCTENGLPIKRNAIASLESGRRESASVAELVAFATVLGVPAASLVYPLTSAPLKQSPTFLGRYGPASEGAYWFTHMTGNREDRESAGIGLIGSEKADQASVRAWYLAGTGSLLWRKVKGIKVSIAFLEDHYLAANADLEDEHVDVFETVIRGLGRLSEQRKRILEEGATIPSLTEIFDLEDLADNLDSLNPDISPGVEKEAIRLRDEILSIIIEEKNAS